MSRYIDADKLQQVYKEIHGGKRSLLIDTEPTADVRENVKGTWKIYCDTKGVVEDCYCDQCGFKSKLLTRYCPNCGADMRGEA